MTHPRNLTGLRQSAQQRHQTARRRADEAIQRLVRAGQPVNFRRVAAAAAVSPAWLYKHADVKARIVALRDQGTPRPPVAPAQRASDASKDALLATFRQRVRALEEENRQLRRKIAVAYGQLYAHGDTAPPGTDPARAD